MQSNNFVSQCCVFLHSHRAPLWMWGCGFGSYTAKSFQAAPLRYVCALSQAKTRSLPVLKGNYRISATIWRQVAQYRVTSEDLFWYKVWFCKLEVVKPALML